MLMNTHTFCAATAGGVHAAATAKSKFEFSLHFFLCRALFRFQDTKRGVLVGAALPVD